MVRISIVGIGYVGLPTAVGFALRGNEVIAVTTTQSKADMINLGKPPIFEKGLEAALKEVLEKKSFRCTTDLEDAIRNSDVTFIAVGTPSQTDGSIDLSQIKTAAEQIAKTLKDKNEYHVVAVKSTVIPGTTESIVLPALEKFSGKIAGKDFGVAMNPEFLREGSALDDFLNADRAVIGSIDEKSAEAVEECYRQFNAPVVKTNTKTAELIKYASNALLASLISFSNEMSDIAEHVKGIDIGALFRGIHLDHRITQEGKTAGIAHYIKSGCGYGGSCFPKDVNAIISHAESLGYNPGLLKEVKRINDERVNRIISRAEKLMPLQEKTICILGAAFKADTDDTRESQAIKLLETLLEKGAMVRLYDPMALKNVEEKQGLTKTPSARAALENADLCIIMTDWSEFRNLEENDFKSLMKNPVVFDTKNILPRMPNINYISVGEVSG